MRHFRHLRPRRGFDPAQLGLFALQHRGQEACGIVSADGGDLHEFRSIGLVADVLNEEALRTLTGTSAIGHTRYSTAGKNTIKEVQPFSVTCQHGQIAVCHNGNLPFADAKTCRARAARARFSPPPPTPKRSCTASPARRQKLRRGDRKSPERYRGSLLAAVSDADKLYRRARPARVPSAGSGQVARRPGASHPRPAPST